jgi:DNA-binding response OmpR family regulator
MSDQWWRKLKTYLKGDAKVRGHILAFGPDPSIQQVLGKTFGSEVEVTYDDGATPIFNLLGNGPPDVILAELELFRNSELSDRIKGDNQVAGVPLLLLADEEEMISDDQLVHWGAAGIISQPLDADELKLKVGDFLNTYTTTTADKFREINREINIDEFGIDNLDEQLRNLNR